MSKHVIDWDKLEHAEKSYASSKYIALNLEKKENKTSYTSSGVEARFSHFNTLGRLFPKPLFTHILSALVWPKFEYNYCIIQKG